MKSLPHLCNYIALCKEMTMILYNYTTCTVILQYIQKIASCTQTLNAPWISHTSDSWNIYIYICIYTYKMYNDAVHTVHKNIIVYTKYSASRQGWVQIHICDQIKVLLSQIKYIAFPDFNSNLQYTAIC